MVTSEVELTVRYAECDPLGIVHHSRYFVYLELARTEQLKQHGYTYVQLQKEGVAVVVADLDAKFRAPAYYDDTLIIQVTLEKVTAMRIIHGYRIFKKGQDGSRQLLAEAHTTLACVNRQGELVPVSPMIREFFRASTTTEAATPAVARLGT